MDLKNLVPFVLGHVQKRTITQYARVIHKDVQSAEGIESSLNNPLGTRKSADRFATGYRIAALGLDLCNDASSGIALPRAIAVTAQIVDNNLGASACEQQGMFPADAAAGARDDGDLARKASHDGTPTGSLRPR